MRTDSGIAIGAYSHLHLYQKMGKDEVYNRIPALMEFHLCHAFLILILTILLLAMIEYFIYLFIRGREGI